VPVFNFGASYPVPRELFTSAYKLILFGLTARMNDAPFRGLKKGECLFLGATAEERTGQPYVIVNYKFAGSPEKTFTNSEIGDLIGFTKRGWDYLWIRYGSTTDANTLVRQPVAGYVERVYEFGDFSLLGLGV
jgi:hypothetical protein